MVRLKVTGCSAADYIVDLLVLHAKYFRHSALRGKILNHRFRLTGTAMSHPSKVRMPEYITSSLGCVSYPMHKVHDLPGLHIRISTKHNRKGTSPGRCNSSDCLWLQEAIFGSPNSNGCSMSASEDNILIICVKKKYITGRLNLCG